jgi:hypothetical protein
VLTEVSEERITSIFRVEEKEENPQAKNQREQVFTCYKAPNPRKLLSSMHILF